MTHACAADVYECVCECARPLLQRVQHIRKPLPADAAAAADEALAVREGHLRKQRLVKQWNQQKC